MEVVLFFEGSGARVASSPLHNVAPGAFASDLVWLRLAAGVCV